MTTNTFYQQSLLAQYCRTGNSKPILGATKHLPQYRRLVRNIVADALQNAYPLSYELLGNERWSLLVDDFLAKHACSSPLLWEMPKDLLQYLEAHTHPLTEIFPQLYDLLLVEWMEIEVFMMEDKAIPPHNKKGNLLLINPEIVLLTLDYPVHTTPAPEIKRTQKAQYIVSIHRHLSTGHVHFTDLSKAFTALILQLLEKPLTNEQAVGVLTVGSDEKQAKQAFTSFLKQSAKSGLLLGYLDQPTN
jgi:uncharacterized protein